MTTHKLMAHFSVRRLATALILGATTARAGVDLSRFSAGALVGKPIFSDAPSVQRTGRMPPGFAKTAEAPGVTKEVRRATLPPLRNRLPNRPSGCPCAWGAASEGEETA